MHLSGWKKFNMTCDDQEVSDKKLKVINTPGRIAFCQIID